jgi:hypothetical protein
MHNGIAVVLLASAIAYRLRDESWEWPQLIALSVGALLAGIRGRNTRDTFNDTVDKFMAAANAPPPSRSIPAETEK